MKKIIYLILMTILLIPNIIFAKEKELNLYLFYGEGCPHCKQLKIFLDEYMDENPNIKLYQYEIWNSAENRKKFIDVMEITENRMGNVPYLVIGEGVITGYGDYTAGRIETYINYYENMDFQDKVGEYLGVVEKQEGTQSVKPPEETIDDLSLPSNLKKIAKESPLILTTILVGLVDGFNPCAMWILLLLISMLITVKDKKRKWILGITFLLTTAVVYFLFLLSWIELSVVMGKLDYIKLAIATLAMILGILSIAKFVKSLFRDDGCEVVSKNNRKRIIKSITKIVKEKSFFLAVLGIILLAVSVNIVELLCSVGLPAAFAQVLAINNTTREMRILYSIIYVIAFTLDDFLVFFISMKTLEIKAISNKYSKYSSLIGGILMLIIGLLMLYKPEWLMLSF